MTLRQNNKGHRQRLREKFLKSGLDGFHDYEIIELLLTIGTPRKDCKQPAKEAFKKFGSLKAVLEANPKDLKEIKGIGENNIFGLKIAQAVSRRYLADRVINKDFIRSSDEVLEYLKHNLRDKNREVFLVIYLNGRNQIMKMEVVFEGTLSTSVVYPREVIKRALDNDAAA
ncbi:MAG TPA: DNA repair protein RadC, partial [Candidatus Marinimicrobia bacterium]|nr:DNA repair protein RadC [Candidatus Neomarinimicrobiota bacterium]